MKSERARLSLSHHGHVAAVFSLVFSVVQKNGRILVQDPVKKILRVDVCTNVSARMADGDRLSSHIISSLGMT